MDAHIYRQPDAHICHAHGPARDGMRGLLAPLGAVRYRGPQSGTDKRRSCIDIKREASLRCEVTCIISPDAADDRDEESDSTYERRKRDTVEQAMESHTGGNNSNTMRASSSKHLLLCKSCLPRGGTLQNFRRYQASVTAG